TFVLNNAYAGTDTEYSNFVFKVYNTEKFLKILSLQDAEVLVNGKKISNDNYHAKMQGNVAQISLRAMLEAFGSEVTWKDEEQAIMFTCGEDRYKFRLNEYGVTEHSDILVSTAGGEYEPVFWRAEKLYYKMIDDRVIIWEGMAVDRFSKIFEKRAKMDYDKLTIDFVDI
ncbi:MAG: hypothetical protein RR957_06235, partial [Oscillospiraceae bacterium]